jgi:hypothetical protein
MAKPEKKVATKARTKVSRLDKALRKLTGTTAKTPFSMKTGLFTVTGYSVVPNEVPGYLIDRTATHTIYRHKATSASKKMVVSVFANSDVLQLLGGKEGGSVTVRRRSAFTSATGTLKFDGTSVIVTDDNGGVAVFDLAAGDYEIKAFDTEGSQASGRGVKSASDDGKKKKAKVTDIKEGGKKKVKK